MSASHHALFAEGLRKSFGTQKVLEGLDFKVERGAVLGLLGPNGAGKTTTVKILSTLIEPDGGRAEVNGFDVVKEADKVRASIGLTGQYAAVDDLLTGRENLEMMGRLYRLPRSECRERAARLLEQFDLAEAGSKPVKTYSGGMRRKLDLAASLIARPSVLFLDEPTTGLDPRSRMTLWDIIKQLAAGDTTILLTTQYMDEADFLADRIMVVDKGRIIAEGTPDQLKAQVGSDTLELILPAGADLDAALKAIATTGAHADPKRRSIALPAKGGVSELKAVLSRLESAKVSVESVSLHRPTLDDVFLTLTGHATSEAEGKEAAK
jgi:ABC-2 type transport system ATP-binding protein